MKIEKRSIDWIPSEERYGKAKDLFYIWFNANMHITTLLTGGLSIILGLNIFYSILSIIIGNLIGAIFMALHSAQGPELGIPQMIQSRAQFGIIGAIVPLILVLFMYMGFFSTASLLAAQTITGAFPAININMSIIILNLIVFFVALYGYKMIHWMQKVLTWPFIIVYIITTIIALRMPQPLGAWSISHFNLSMFILSVAISATWQIAYAPYVADYSRYLPEDISKKQTFFYSYLGTVIGSVWLMVLGVILVSAIPNFLNNSGYNLANLFGGFSIILYIIVILGSLSINSYSLYCAFMSATTIIEPFVKMKVTENVRAIFMGALTIIGCLIEILGHDSFLPLFKDFILFISYFLIPWTTINLLDFYLLRKGKYSVNDFFDMDGEYGKFNMITIAAYIISIIVEIPFVNTTLYVGPFCKALGGADISWIFGLIIPVFLYYIPMKKKMLLKNNIAKEVASK